MKPLAAPLTTLPLCFAAAASLAGCGLNNSTQVHVTCFSGGQKVVDEIAIQPSLGGPLTGPNGEDKSYPREICTFEKLPSQLSSITPKAIP